ATDAVLVRKIQAVQRLEALGSPVAIVQADVADADELARAVAAARAQFGAVHGVVHAAGVAGGGALSKKTAASIGEVVRPKVEGSVALHAALCEGDLDFFVLCSSMNAIVGAYGLYEYCAANAFQDAFAQRHDGTRRTRYIAINWNAWKEVGMAA